MKIIKYIIFIIMFITLCSFIYADYIDDLNNNIESYYKFDGDVTDAVGTSNGTNNGADSTLTGKISTAYDFVPGNSDYVRLNQNSVTSSYSISLWFAPDTDGNTRAYHTASGYVVVGVGIDSSFPGTVDDKFYCQGYDGSKDVAVSTTSYSVGTYSHVVCTSDGTNIRIYVNGVLEDTTASGNPSNVGLIDIGGTGSRYFDGKIDEIALFNNYVLDLTEVQFLYASGTPTSDQQYLFSSGVTQINYTQILLTSPSPDQNLTNDILGNTSDTTPTFQLKTNVEATLVQINGSTSCTSADNLTWTCTHPELSYGDNYNIYFNGTDGTNTFDVTRTIYIYDNPTPSSLSYVSSGGDSTNYLQEITHINVTVTDLDSDINYVEIFVYDPTSTIININMTNRTGTVWDYNTSFTLNSIGTWNITVTATDSLNLTGTTSTTFVVSKTSNATASDNYYGYDMEAVNTTAELDTTAMYDYNLFGHRMEWSNFSTKWSNVKRNINHTYEGYNARNFITIYFDDSDYANATADTDCTTINNNFTDLKTYPYLDSMAFLVIETNVLANRDSFINRVSECLLSATGNNFPIYSKNYNSSGFDLNYVLYWNMPYIWTSDLATWVNMENGYLRNTTSLTRIYANADSTLWLKHQMYHNNVLTYIRSTPNITTTIAQTKATEFLNQDLIVFNNQSTAQNVSVDYVNAYGSDAWDFTHKVLYKTLSGAIDILVDIYSATLVYIDTFDQLFMTDTTTSTLFKSSTTGTLSDTYSDGGTADGSFSIVSANDVRGELWSPDFVHDNLFMHTYEQLNYSLVTDFSDYDIIVINKGTTANSPSEVNASLDPITNPGILDKTFGYISVADYNNTNATGQNITNCSEINSWELMKEAEADIWTDSYHTNVFIDGFDIGYSITPECFEERIKRVGDHIRFNKGKKTIFNTYTIYESVSNYGDYVMRESCFSRWDGTVGSPVYSYENISLMIDNAEYFATSTKPVLCMAFGDVNDYDKMMYDFMAFAVLYGADGDNLFRYAQPNFQVQREIKVPDLGAMLGSSYNNNSVTDWYRTYENGIVHFNPYRNETYDNGKYYWFDDGKTVNSISVWGIFQLYSAGCDSSKNQKLYINEDNLQIIHDTDISPTCIAWTTTNLSFSLPVSAYEPHGHYYLRIEPETRGAGVGINIFNRVNTLTGVHSWYDNTANNPPTESQWIPYGRIGNTSKQTINWKMYIDINTTTRASVDNNINNINQTNSQYDWSTDNRNITLTTTESYNISIISRPVYIPSITLLNVTYNGNLLSVLNTTTCNTTEPMFSYTTISGQDWGVCQTPESSGYTYRFDLPILESETSFIILTERDITPPTIYLNISPQIIEAITGTGIWNITVSDNESGIGTNWNINMTYPNGTIQTEMIGVIDADNSIQYPIGLFTELGTWNASVWAMDNDGNIATATTYFIIVDTTSPSLSWSEPELNLSYINDTLINLTMNVTCSDLIELNNVTMYVNGVINETNNTIVNGTPWLFTFYPSTYTTYNINFSCYDSSGNVNNSDTRIFSYSSIPTTTTTTTITVTGGGGSGSPVLQTSGECDDGYYPYNFVCVPDSETYLTKFVLNNFDTSVCPTKKVYWSFKNSNNLGNTEKADDMYLIFKYNNGDVVNKSLSYYLNRYNYNDYIDFKGQSSLIIELQSVFTVADIQDSISYKTNIVPGTCDISDFNLIPAIVDNIDNLKNVTSTKWKDIVYNEDGTKNKKNAIIMIILIITLLFLLYYLILKN